MDVLVWQSRIIVLYTFKLPCLLLLTRGERGTGRTP
jgi:hypothetical protein